jgi:cholesterol transport system auxiliary component
VAERALPTLLITTPHAAAGYDSQRIIYVREDHKLAYFAHSEWVDSPARMLGPLLMATIEKTRAFGAVVSTPANAAGDLRLDTQIIRLQHNFQTSPSRVQFTLRAYLTDEKTRRVLAWREFNGEAPATRETAQGGVNAANLVVQDVMTQLAQFLALPR